MTSSGVDFEAILASMKSFSSSNFFIEFAIALWLMSKATWELELSLARFIFTKKVRKLLIAISEIL